MKTITFILLLAGIMLFGGCATKVTGEDGRKYQPLSASEVQRLVNISRISLKNSLKRRIISRSEYQFMLKNEPGIRITYRGDRFGTAIISWQTTSRVLEFRYEDDLSATVIAGCSFSTYEIPEHERGIMPDKSIPGR